MKEIITNISFSHWMLAMIVISLLAGFVFRVKYFNFFEIIKNYFEIFKDQNGKISILAIYMANILPLWIALFLKDFFLEEKVDYETELLIVTILTALFFSVFGIIFSLKDKLKDKNYLKGKSASEKVILNKLVDSVLYINMFEIVISIFILILCFIGSLIEQKEILNIIIYYLLFVLLINMFILLKRLHVTLREIM